MVLPLYKALSLLIRVFSRPLVNYTRQAHIKNNGQASHPRLRASFIWLGNSSSKLETWVNRKFMKIDSQFAYKPLNDELALEKGIQFFYEMLFYSLMIGLPLYEMTRASNEAEEKSKRTNQKLQNIDKNLKELKDMILKNEEMKKNRDRQIQHRIQGMRKTQIKLSFPNGKIHSYDLI